MALPQAQSFSIETIDLDMESDDIADIGLNDDVIPESSEK